MKQLSPIFGILTGVALLPVLAMARTYDTSHLPYSDAPNDRETAVAISVLTEADILEGNPDGTFKPNTNLNRAEFVTIAMRLMPQGSASSKKCFPDVAETAWYADAVCRAKELGIVRGNAVTGVAESKWKFEPTRPVQYEEAVKVLVNLYSLASVNESGVNMQWYVPFIDKAEDLGLDISGVRVGENITRGEMARLTANFFAHSHGELDDLQDAQSSSSSSRSSSSRSSSRSSSSRSSSSSNSSSSSSTQSTGAVDPDTDVSIRTGFILLGEVSQVLGAVDVFNDNEPFRVETFVVNLGGSTPSVSAVRVFDDQKRYLGRATRTSGNTYELKMASQNFIIPQRQEYTFYVRAETRSPNDGGVSGENIQVTSMGVSGSGDWSQDDYSKMSTETFPAFEAADAVLTTINSAGPENSPLVGGQNTMIGSFNFTAEEASNAAAGVEVTDLSFYLATTGGVSVGSIVIRDSTSPESHSCTLGGNIVTCTNIPAGIGSVDEGTPTNLQVFANVVVPGGTSNASLRLSIVEPGTFSTPGAVTWTDGTTEFTWVGDTNPLANGTYYSL